MSKVRDSIVPLPCYQMILNVLLKPSKMGLHEVSEGKAPLVNIGENSAGTWEGRAASILGWGGSVFGSSAASLFLRVGKSAVLDTLPPPHVEKLNPTTHTQ